jgi:hypothetical protein
MSTRRDGATLGVDRPRLSDALRDIPALQKRVYLGEGALPSAPYVNYFQSGDSPGLPLPPVACAADATFKNIILSWTLPSEAAWRKYEVYEGSTSNFTPDFLHPLLVTDQNVVTIAKAAGTGPWYYKVHSINSRGERSTLPTTFGPLTMPLVSNAEVTSIAATKVTTGSLAADVVVTCNLVATKITSGTLDCTKVTVASLNAGSITSGTLNAIDITGATITGARIKTASAGKRIELGSVSAVNSIDMYSGSADELAKGSMLVDLVDAGGGTIRPAIVLTAPNMGPGATSGISIFGSTKTGGAGSIALQIATNGGVQRTIYVNGGTSGTDVYLQRFDTGVTQRPTIGFGTDMFRFTDSGTGGWFPIASGAITVTGSLSYSSGQLYLNASNNVVSSAGTQIVGINGAWCTLRLLGDGGSTPTLQVYSNGAWRNL